MFAQMLQETHDGTFDNPYYRFGIADGAMLVDLNEGLKGSIPPEAITAMEQAMKDIADGKLVVEFVPE